MGHRWSRCAAGIALMLRANDGLVRPACMAVEKDFG